ncbi:hypothetical protein LRP52_49405 [Photobacterium sp. ZSDE20]|nr:hypothetical protein [Photobacterium sp. ZSDE20]
MKNKKMALLVIASLMASSSVLADTIRLENATDKQITVFDGDRVIGAENVQNGNHYWAFHPTSRNLKLVIGDDTYNLTSSLTGKGSGGCNYNFSVIDSGNYQNGKGCKDVLPSLNEGIFLENASNNPIYPAFDTGWGFSADSVFGFLTKGHSTFYSLNNKYLKALGLSASQPLNRLGVYDAATTSYVVCGTDVNLSDFSGFSYTYEDGVGTCSLR